MGVSVLCVTHYKKCVLRNQITFFLNLQENMSYFFSNSSYFVSHVLTDSSRVAMLSKIGTECSGVVCCVNVTVVLD